MLRFLTIESRTSSAARLPLRTPRLMAPPPTRTCEPNIRAGIHAHARTARTVRPDFPALGSLSNAGRSYSTRRRPFMFMFCLTVGLRPRPSVVKVPTRFPNTSTFRTSSSTFNDPRPPTTALPHFYWARTCAHARRCLSLSCLAPPHMLTDVCSTPAALCDLSESLDLSRSDGTLPVCRLYLSFV